MTRQPAPTGGERERDERDLRIFRGMKAVNAFICWECRTVQIKNHDWWALNGCEKCGERGYVLPFLLRPAARHPHTEQEHGND